VPRDLARLARRLRGGGRSKQAAKDTPAPERVP